MFVATGLFLIQVAAELPVPQKLLSRTTQQVKNIRHKHPLQTSATNIRHEHPPRTSATNIHREHPPRTSATNIREAGVRNCSGYWGALEPGYLVPT